MYVGLAIKTAKIVLRLLLVDYEGRLIGRTLLLWFIRSVGPHPSNLRYTSDCRTLIVADEGLPGKDEAGAYFNPEGSVTIIHGEGTGNPTVRRVDFGAFNIGEPNYK